MAIIDVMMPGIDGFALVEQLVEADAVLPPALYLTARIEVAVHAHVDAPVGLVVLDRVVNQVIPL